jgi:hypothetical protein
MKYAEIASGGMIYIPRFMAIRSGFEVILKLSQKHNRSLKVAVQEPDYYGPPFMHSRLSRQFERLHYWYY